MRFVVIIMLLVNPMATTRTQPSSEREHVLKAVQTFFDTMAEKDLDGFRKIMIPQARFHSIDMAKPASEPRALSTEEAVASLQQTKQTFRERIWNPEVRVHGSIATVWAPYDFWIDGKFSHCGVDAFDLVKTAEGWKISGGAYTMEAKCDPSPLGPLKQ